MVWFMLWGNHLFLARHLFLGLRDVFIGLLKVLSDVGLIHLQRGSPAA